MGYARKIRNRLRKKVFLGWALIIVCILMLMLSLFLAQPIHDFFPESLDMVVNATFIVFYIFCISLLILSFRFILDYKAFLKDKKYLKKIVEMHDLNEGIIESNDLAENLDIPKRRARKILLSFVKYGLLKQDTDDLFYFYDSPLIEKVKSDEETVEVETKEAKIKDDLSVEVYDVKKEVKGKASGKGPKIDKEAENMFASHAKLLLRDEEYSNWEAIVSGKPQYGITAAGPDDNEILHRILIKASGQYPDSPPTIVVRPRLHEECWNTSGKLEWEDCSEIKWSDFKGKENPLKEVVGDILNSFKLGV